MDGNELVWVIGAGDTAVAGLGSMQVLGVADDKRKLSAAAETLIRPATTPKSAEPPEVDRPWVDRVLAAADVVEQGEQGREAAEAERAEAERVRAAAESQRAAAESERANAESGRVNAEQERAAAESDRVAAEEARATEFAGFSGEITQLKDDLTSLESSTVIYTEPTNLLHGTITSGYIINADGSVTERSDYSYSDYIEIDNSKGYIAFTRQATATTRIMDGMTTAFYDESKTFISRVGGNVKTIPNNAAYIRQNILTSYLSNVYKPMVEYVNSTGSNIAPIYSDWFEPYHALLANYGANFKNKKICVYGDSLAANGNGGDNAWINILASVLDFEIAYNRGIGGSRVTDTETRYAYVDADGDAYNRSSYTTQQTVPAGYTEINPCMSLTERINTIPTDTDVLIILAGANDASGVTLDAIRTAYATMLDGIYARVPNARILLGTLLYNNNWDGNESAQIVEKYNGIRSIIKDMGALYGYPVIDFKGRMGVNKLNYTEFMDSDGVHYTTKSRGKNRIAEAAIPNVFDIKYVT